MDANVRPSQIAGLWYEGQPKALSHAVDSYMDEASLPALPGEVIGVVAPHAGHRYSGPVAGYAFAAVRGKSPDIVAVLSPFHNYHSAPLLTSSYGAYGTPLGPVPVEHSLLKELNEMLTSQLGFGLSAIANDPEHSLEIELPFLQRALASNWKLLPIMVRAQEPEVCRALGMAVAKLLQGKNALLVASTDLSHYYEQQVALVLDRSMLTQLEAYEPERLFDVERSGHGYACGLGALTAVMWAARELGADSIQLLRHATSGDVTGDYSAVVGYGAAAMLRTKQAAA